MEEDGQSIPSQKKLRKKRLEERATKKAAFQKAVDQAQANRDKKGTRKKAIDIDDESTVTGGNAKATGGDGKQKGRKPSLRGRSLLPTDKKGKLKALKSRATSVDSSISKHSIGSSDSSGSSSKCKPSPTPTPKATKKTSKSAKFSDGIPDNEGKTASTKKQAKEKKRETYANKATKGKKKQWIYTTVMEYRTHVGKCSNVTSEMYSCQASVLCIFQDDDPECAIGNHINAKAEPLRSPGEFKFKSHGHYIRHYKLDYKPD